MAIEPLLAVFSLALAGLEFATWSFAFETRKTFKGGIFFSSWALIGTSLLFLLADQLSTLYQAVMGESELVGDVGESFEAIAVILLLLGFYMFYRAWNPQGMASEP